MTVSANTVIVGGGQGGLSVSYYLTQQAREHIILEQADRAAERWRNHVWDSFTFVTPNWLIQLPGAPYQGDDPDGFMARNEIVAYFERYIERFESPVHFGVHVTSVEAKGNGYLVDTDTEQYQAANVVIATGTFQKPKVPPFANNLPTEIHQLHSSEYRNPNALSSGSVLVVGSAQSGCQIAEELYRSGRKVYLSVGSAGRIPRRYRGKETGWWLNEMGFFDQTVDSLPSPQARFGASAHVSGGDGGHTINLHQFARDGVKLIGRIEAVAGETITVAPDLKENLAKADKFEADLLRGIDTFIEKSGIDAPMEDIPELRDGYDAEVIRDLDLNATGISSVIWATGYQFDYGFVRLPVLGEHGYPIQKRGVTEYAGLYFNGLHFLHDAKSGLLYGVGEDAAYVASQIADSPQ